VRIDQEEGQDLAVAWFGGVCEFKWLHLVLEDVGEGEQAAGAC